VIPYSATNQNAPVSLSKNLMNGIMTSKNFEKGIDFKTGGGEYVRDESPALKKRPNYT
jgi:hypothetical protein